MIPSSNRPVLSKKSSAQLGPQNDPKWDNLDSEMVLRVQSVLNAWIVAVECRTRHIFRHTGARRNCWKRTYNPVSTLKPLNWERNLQRIATWIADDWNLKLRPAEEKIALTANDIMDGRLPPGLRMRPRDAADLQQPPQIIETSRKHLIGYLSDLSAAIARAQTTHATAERTLRETRATIYESLGLWDFAAKELDQLAKCNSLLGDHVYVVRAMLRRGVALYRLGQFEPARDALVAATAIIKSKLKPHVDLRTELAVWDYLGLCLVRLGQSKRALKEVYLRKEHRKRINLLSTPLGDASRLVRMGIAFLELNRFDEAKKVILSGAKKRASVAAWPEAARALRYLGHWYFRKKNYPAALTIWEIAIKRQRAVGDDIEEARLLYQRGEAFRHLTELADKAPKEWIEVSCALTAKLFPVKNELDLLRAIQGPYTDTFDFYPVPQARFTGYAYASYSQCIEIASRRRLTELLSNSETAISFLSADRLI
jgi:tetratricopeptide (TPR) repeat protein